MFLPVGTVAVFGLFALFALVFTALWLWSLVDALQFSDQRWTAAGENKMLWVLLIVFLGIIGSVLYVAIPRPALRNAQAL